MGNVLRQLLVTAGVALFLLLASSAFPRAQADPSIPGILVTRQLMAERNLQVGEVVTLAADPSGAGGRAFRIAGEYEPAADPMRFAQPRLEATLHLPDLIALTADPAEPGDADTVGTINVALKDPARAAEFSRDVAARVPGAVARPVSDPDERTTTFVVLERFHLAIAIVTVIGSAVFLLALMVMLVEERRATVGVLRLLGFTRRRILLQVSAEGALIAGAGALFGVLFALASQGAFNSFFQWRYDTTLVFLRMTPAVVLQSLALAVPLGILASIIASWTLLRRELLALLGR